MSQTDNTQTKPASLGKPIICVTFDYYSEPSEALVKEIYDCILDEAKEWKKKHKDTLEATHLYEHFTFGAPRYMLVIRFKEIGQAATFLNSKEFSEIRNMAICAGFNLNCNLFNYARGEEDEIGYP